jgi:asparagine synthase (glutamine-hydrolysing)
VRLSINDIDARANQPLHAENCDIHAVVNGEFYDYRDLKSELENEYTFQTTSDSELIIALYLKYGTSLFSKLRGEFAFVLYDGRRQVLLAARDRYGIKPLFWTVHEDQLLIASEVKAFLHMGWKAQWDVRSIIEDGWLHDERTIFRRVNKVAMPNSEMRELC